MKPIKSLSIILFLLLFNSNGNSNNFDLPDLGNSSDTSLSPLKEAEIRDEIIQQIYQYDLVMFDPFIAAYIEELGYRIASHSNNPQASFDFFIVNENIINASTYPGGLIIFFSGLILKTETESELAAVMAHEVAHATQRHLSRMYEDVSKNTIPALLGLLGAVVASQQSDSRDAPIAIASATMAMQQQAMINFTRENEYEADRVGISTLIKANFNPKGMASFFEKLMENNPVDPRYQPIEYIRTHPLSINRVSEAKSRMPQKEINNYVESEKYLYIKERIRIFTKNTDLDHVNYYQKLFSNTPEKNVTDAQKYGYALSLHLSSQNQKALDMLKNIKISSENKLYISVLKAEIYADIDSIESIKLFANLYDFYPESPIIIIPYINILIKSKDFKNINYSRQLARKLTQLSPENPNYFQLLAISNQNANKPIEANEALAMKEHLINNNYRAVRILKNILKSELDYYQRARIEAKITEFEALITDKERHREVMAEKTGRQY